MSKPSLREYQDSDDSRDSKGVLRSKRRIKVVDRNQNRSFENS